MQREITSIEVQCAIIVGNTVTINGIVQFLDLTIAENI